MRAGFDKLFNVFLRTLSLFHLEFKISVSDKLS